MRSRSDDLSRSVYACQLLWLSSGSLAGECRGAVRNCRPSLVAIGYYRSLGVRTTYDDTHGRRALHAAAWPAYARRAPRGPHHGTTTPATGGDTHGRVLLVLVPARARSCCLSPAIECRSCCYSHSTLQKRSRNRTGMPCYGSDLMGSPEMPSAPIRRPRLPRRSALCGERPVPVSAIEHDQRGPALLQAREILPPQLLVRWSLSFDRAGDGRDGRRSDRQS